MWTSVSPCQAVAHYGAAASATRAAYFAAQEAFNVATGEVTDSAKANKVRRCRLKPESAHTE